jgi:hypothetical protein
VARRIREDELPSRCREVPVRDVNGDALLTLGPSVNSEKSMGPATRLSDAFFTECT